MFRASVRLTHLVIVACGMTALLGGCPPVIPPPGGGNTADPKLVPFESQEEWLNYFRSQASAGFEQRGIGLGDMFGGGAMPPGVPNSAAEGATGAPADAGGDGGGSFTGTNVQETGVDESDFVKSDGTNLYIVRNSSLRIVKAQPREEMAQVGQIEIDEPINAIYLRGSHVLVLASMFSMGNPGGIEIMIWPPFYQGGQMVVYDIDVSDPAEPTIAKRVELDGSLATSRMANDRLIMVLNVVPDLPDNPTPQAVGGMTIEQCMPKMRGASSESDMVPWSGWLHPESPDGYYMTAVVTLNADDIEEVVASVAVMANAGTVYASTEALYLTDATYDSENNFRELTAVHKLSFDADGAARYVASGAVPGRLLNQFSLSEKDGNLRLATTISPTFNWGVFEGGGGIAVDVGVSDAAPPTAVDAREQDVEEPTEPASAVFVLAEDAADLKIIGEVRGIAPGERMFAARFIGDTSYLVTFEQIDPLFVISLADPTAPTVLGELEVPGFSEYLHPLGDSHLIGVGRATREAEWGGVIQSGLQLSLFDISDLTNPTLVQQLAVGGDGSSSEVAYDHKAFTLTQIDGDWVLAIPAEIWANDAEHFVEGKSFDGILTYRVDPAAGFTELGRLNIVVDGEFDWVPWRRASLVNDTLYAISAEGVNAAEISDLTANTTLIFED